MKRLTWKRSLDGYTDVGLRKGVKTYEAICKLADYEEAEAEAALGRWNEINQISTGLPWKYRCNKCGCPQDYAHNYCPNCGARMNG